MVSASAVIVAVRLVPPNVASRYQEPFDFFASRPASRTYSLVLLALRLMESRLWMVFSVGFAVLYR